METYILYSSGGNEVFQVFIISGKICDYVPFGKIDTFMHDEDYPILTIHQAMNVPGWRIEKYKGTF